ncbi:glycerate kinase [Enemella evansiae]|uniref:glycerate kinase n=1 Tax=Enemella evansiae TaxID=2016499 RepID=UPI0010EE6535|nr:glycerate kinase [Enemella evansiae]TDO92882.1 glycerate kinase [Enemella evansiae]
MSTSSAVTVVIAPDSLKGSLDALPAAEALAAGWHRARPDDDLLLLPQADGGEGTMAALAAGDERSAYRDAGTVTGPDGRGTPGRWLRLGNQDAVLELAQMSGLPLMRRPDPLGANCIGLGQVMAAALADGAQRILVGLGGSASTDGGAGILTGLGARLLDADGNDLPPGGAALRNLARLDTSAMRRPDEVVVLTDVESPLLGAQGAAAVFGPQKGADADDISVLEQGLRRLAEVVGIDSDRPGMGAAGGAGYALAAVLGGRIEPGAPYIASASGLTEAVAGADVLITGEGKFDQTSLSGKVVGHALSLPGAPMKVVVAGAVATEVPGVDTFALADLAGSPAASFADPARWLTEAGARAAGQLRQT